MNSFRNFLPVMLVAGSVFLGAIGCNGASAANKIPDPKVDETVPATKGQEKVVFAGGCFWGIQAVFEHVKGVDRATAGYSGGDVKNPSYEDVSGGDTGYAESVEVIYDPSQITLGQLFKIFFSVAHDPTELNRQGPDDGTQYRSAIFYSNVEQQRIANAYVTQLGEAKVFSHPIVTQIAPEKSFYRAEEYHQDYAAHHPHDMHIMMNDAPKVAALKTEFPNLYVSR